MTEYRWNDGANVSEAIVNAVAKFAGVDPLEMEPIYDGIDPDALDTLFDSRTDGTHRSGGLNVEFRLDGYAVALSSDRRIRVCGPGDA